MWEGGSPDRTAIRYASETKPLADLSWRELRQRVASLADALRKMGVEPGDRVAAYLSNTPDAIVAFLAAASVGPSGQSARLTWARWPSRTASGRSNRRC